MKNISIITTAFNEEAAIEAFVARVDKQVEKAKPNYHVELIVCENGSTDKTYDALLALQKKFDYLRVVKLVRNFGHQGGILAALHEAQGDAIIMLDADGQHPPELIPEMITKWDSEGFVVVNTRRERNIFSIKERIRLVFYWIMKKFSGLDLGDADFRLVDRKVADYLKTTKENEKFIRGLVSWQGYREVKLPYKVNKRIAGYSKFSFFKLVDFAIHGICSFSNKPLRFVSYLGFTLLIPAILGLFWHLYLGVKYFYFDSSFELPPGWLTLSVLMMFFGSVQLLSLGIIAEYIGRIFLEVKARPNFIKEKVE